MPWYTTEHARRDAERQAAQRSKIMDDSTMIDKAAKAAGMKRRSVRWNPLKNSGDALGLAATLQINTATGANEMTATQIANTLIQSAAEFLAAKHGVTVEQIADALEAGNERVAEQLSDLMASAYEACVSA